MTTGGATRMAALVACVVLLPRAGLGIERMAPLHRRTAFNPALGRPSAAPSGACGRPRPHAPHALGSKKKGKRKFRGGMDWDDARLYDEWIKAGAPDEFDFRDIDEIDLDAPPDTPSQLALADEAQEDELAAQLRRRGAGSGVDARGQQAGPVPPPGAGWEAAVPGGGGTPVRRSAEPPARAASGAEASELAIAQALASTRAAASADAAAAAAAPAAGAIPPDVEAELLRAAAPPGGARAGGAAEASAGAEAEPTEALRMPGWERVGQHAWARAEAREPRPPAPPPAFSVPVPPSLRQHILAREAGGVEPQPLWPQTHWRACWVSATDAVQARCLRATWANFNVKIAANFDDLPALASDSYGGEGVGGAAGGAAEAAAVAPGAAEPSLAEEALLRAEMAHVATGLPALADATSVELLPNPDARTNKQYVFRGEVDGRVDDLILKLRPLSAPNRAALFHSAVAFSNGTHRVLADGMCAAALTVANSTMATISRTGAYDAMLEKLAEEFGLPFTGPNVESGGTGEVVLPSERRPAGKELPGARMLRERVLRDGKVLDSGMLKVSSFLNHQVDVGLIEACGEELAVRLERTMPSKILTVEATGLIPAIFVGRHLGVPVVFARKSRPMTISDAYSVSYRSATKGTIQELVVSEEYLAASDRVLLIDDFLAGGSTAEALFKLIKMANAKVVGVGVLIEKLTASGRAFLSGYEVQMESLVKVAMLEGGRIDVLDEPPFIVPPSRDDAPS